MPTVDGLTVRVVNNISKKMEVKPRFLETFKNEGYPDTFPYKQKVTFRYSPHRKSCRIVLSFEFSWSAPA